MRIGLPKEIKEGEHRVSIIPSNVKELVNNGHSVVVEKGAGIAAGFRDDEYIAAGASMVDSEKAVFKEAEFIIKVKEILPDEFNLLEEDKVLFTYIHSENRRMQAEALLNSKVIAFAYENVKDKNSGFPLLLPMSRMAGQVGFLVGINNSFTTSGGLGNIVCGDPGIKPMKIVVLGAGNVGLEVAKLGVALNAEVIMMDVNLKRLKDIIDSMLPKVRTVYSNQDNISKEIADADIVYNSVKWFPGLKLITRDMLKLMKRNSLIVDIDAEPGGAIETSQYTTFDNPVVTVDGVRHIGIPNLPSAVSTSASMALSNATLPYIMQIANKGWSKAAKENEELKCGLNFIKGELTFKETAEAHGMKYEDVDKLLREF